MNRPGVRLLVAMLAAGCALSLWWLPRGEQAAPTPPRPAAPQPAAAEPPVVPPVPVTPPDAAGATQGMLVFPDGSTAPFLNGVTGAPAPVWEAGRPFAPIVGKKTINGIDYYVHADNSTSTTMMVWRPDLGRYDAATRVEHPKEVQPFPDDEHPPPTGRQR